MEVVRARNVNDAYAQGLALLRSQGVCESSRAGEVLVVPCPVTTVYERPCERVLFDPARDANPFFHLFESLWILSGRRDARWLDRFVRDFSQRFAEDDGEQHGAYGFRLRQHFDVEGGGHPGSLPDQLDEVMRLLENDPKDRRVVLTMWDPVADLGVDKRDVPCNTHAYLRVRSLSFEEEAGLLSGVLPEKYRGIPQQVLDLTVCCRSNDAVWGAYGANAVHFSVLQEYLAGRIGVGIGRYYQVSNNFHAYRAVLGKVGVPSSAQPYEEEGDQGVLRPAPMGQDWDHWDADLQSFFEWTEEIEEEGPASVGPHEYVNSWFSYTAEPLYAAHWLWRHGEREHALEIVSWQEACISPDWRLAAHQWFERRLGK